jgi:hypothetical protein
MTDTLKVEICYSPNLSDIGKTKTLPIEEARTLIAEGRAKPAGKSAERAPRETSLPASDDHTGLQPGETPIGGGGIPADNDAGRKRRAANAG